MSLHSEPFAQIPERLLDADVSDRAVRLWCVLHRHADTGGRAWPGRPKLAERIRCGVSSLDRALAELEGTGLLVVEPHFRKDGSRATNSYWLWPAAPPVGTPLFTGEQAPYAPVEVPLPTGDEASRNESQRNESQTESLRADKRRPKTPLPDPFMVTSTMKAWAAEKFPAVDWRMQTEQFKDHHTSNGNTKVDWVAAWRMWMRNAGTKYASRPTNGTAHMSNVEKSWRNIQEALG